jgi:hypothetical protein
MARPKKPIDENLVEKLAKVGCSNESIATQAGCSVDTLTRRYADLLVKSRENLKTQLRIWQLEAAKKGNTAILIWLGKQMLGQTEKIETKTEVKAEVTETVYKAKWGGTNEPASPGRDGDA